MVLGDKSNEADKQERENERHANPPARSTRRPGTFGLAPRYGEACAGADAILMDGNHDTDAERRGERLARVLVDAITDYAIYMLDPDGYVVSWNTGAQRFKGYDAAEILGEHFSRFYTESDRAAGLPAEALRIA